MNDSDSTLAQGAPTKTASNSTTTQGSSKKLDPDASFGKLASEQGWSTPTPYKPSM